jgi:hypothetical protein
LSVSAIARTLFATHPAIARWRFKPDNPLAGAATEAL